MDTLAAECPSCGRSMRLPAAAVGKKVKCGGCAEFLRIGAVGDDGSYTLTRTAAPATPTAAAATAAPVAPAAPAAMAAEPACPDCRGAVQAADEFCQHCGVDLAASRAKAAEMARHNEEIKQRRRRLTRADNQQQITKAGRWLLGIGVVFAGFGTWQGLNASKEAGHAHAQLAARPQAEVVEISGKQMTIGELREQLDFEVMMVFGINYLLAAIMIGLWFWAQRAAFPALLTGLCVYLVVQVLSAVVDPSTLVQGWIWKILIISGLLGGMAAALKERAARRATGHRHERLARAR